MQKEIRTVCYDDDCHHEAYRFEGIVRPFPNHLHFAGHITALMTIVIWGTTFISTKTIENKG